jgi:hypothetical protein
MRTIEEIIINGKCLKDILQDEVVDLHGANLHGANLSGANLSWANLYHANLYHVDLTGANLCRANLTGANLTGANLSGADLSGANLKEATLSRADLTETKLYCADLTGANLTGADLTGADLSGANGLLNPANWLANNFRADDLGYIVYKAIGNTEYTSPVHWTINPGEFITEVVNPLPTVDCGCGVNFATLAWIQKYYQGVTIWRCRIRWIDLPNVVVPYNTNGKARCGRLELLEIMQEVE